MKYFNPVIIIVILLSSNSISIVFSDTETCKHISNVSPNYKLKNYLFCDYNTNVRPTTKPSNATKVEINFLPKFVQFDDHSRILKISCWTDISWQDPHLAWTPSDFSGISMLHVTSYDIWVPDVAVHNSGDFGEDQTGIAYTNCIVDQSGEVFCVPPTTYNVHCSSDYSTWPFDTLSCTVEIASWAHHAGEIVLHNKQNNAIMSDFSTSQEWEVLKTKIWHQFQEYKKLDDGQESSVIYFQLWLQRRSTKHLLRVLPGFVLMVLTLCMLWLDPVSTERMLVACITFICHLLCIQDLSSALPPVGSTTPNILLFYEKSLIIMSFGIVLTILLRTIREFKTAAPQWVSSLTIYVLRSKIGQILMLSILDPQASHLIEKSADDNADFFKSDKKDSTWSYICILISWIVFISTFFTYLVMFAVLMQSRKVQF